MAVRIRKDKTIVCAAKSEIQDGDVYIDDGLHYVLASELVVLSVCGVNDNGAELWEFHSPMTLEERIKKEQALLNRKDS